MAIKSFGDKATEKLWNGGRVRAFEEVAKYARRKLAMLDQATTLHDLKSPGSKLHPLTGDLEGFWSLWITNKWRVIFKWTAEGAHEVKVTDYHY